MLNQQAEALWDEGIAAFLNREYSVKKEPITSGDLQRLANQHAVRVGDLLETLHLMTIYGSWHYCGSDGSELDIDEQALDTLYARGRIEQTDMGDFTGVWVPSL